MLLSITANAEKVEINGIWYNLIRKAQEAEVTSGNWIWTDRDMNDGRYTGTVIVPDSIEYDGIRYVVNSIGRSAFCGCETLTTVILPNTIKKIDYSAFSFCYLLQEIIIPDGVETISELAFQSCNSFTNITIPSSVTSIGYSAFINCEALSSVNLSDALQSIGQSVFMNCYNLKTISFPNNLNTISSNCFTNCTSLSSVDLPLSLVYIESSAFLGCTSLDSVVIPNNVRSIGEKAFGKCDALKTLTIGSGVTRIDNEAFASCKELSDVYCYSVNAPITGRDVFKDSYIDYAILHVPSSSINAYKNTEPWKSFKEIVAIGEETKENPKCAPPTIVYNNGKIIFNCETEGVEFVSEITDVDVKKHFDSEISLSATYIISVYATKEGYEKSDVIYATLCWIDSDPKTEGIENSIANIRTKAVLIQNNGSTLSIIGADEGVPISIYDTTGRLISSTKASTGTTSIETTLQSGEIGIVKIGNKAVKVAIK